VIQALGQVGPFIILLYNKYFLEERIFVTPNGARSDLFEFNKECEYKNRSIYLAKITDRKKQYLYQDIDFLDFAGNMDDHRFNTNRSNYLGEWTKDHLYENLSKYSNLVLLSDGEAHPLVCCEALMCGLGLVISECSAANLDLEKPFITVIKDSDLHNIDFVKSEILKNQEISNLMREEIRQYGLDKFSWESIVNRYVDIIQKII
jgi:glycosyltransferase involved in cell wall biosynthesis